MYSNPYDSTAMNPYGNVYNPMNAMQMPMQLPKTRTGRVNGRQGAEMYRMAPDSDIVLLDENDPMIWFIQTDSAGYKTIIPYDIAPHTEEKAPDMKSLDDRLNSFDDRLRALEEALK